MSTNQTWVNGALAVTNGGEDGVDLKVQPIQENPFGTAEGQGVISISESFWARLFREGRPRNAQALGVNISTLNSYVYQTQLTPSKGVILYPKRAIISFSVDAELVVQVTTGIADADIHYYLAFVKAGTPLQVEFDGDIWCNENGNVKLGVRTSGAGTFYASVYGVEVAQGA